MMEVFSQTIILIVVIATLINSSEGLNHENHKPQRRILLVASESDHHPHSETPVSNPWLYKYPPYFDPSIKEASTRRSEDQLRPQSEGTKIFRISEDDLTITSRGIVGIREQDLGQQQQQHDHHRNNAEEREGKVTVDNALVETKYVRGLPPTSSLPSRPRPILFTTTTTRPPPSLQNYNLVRLPPLRNSLHVPVAEVEESPKEQRGEVGEEEEEGRKNVYYSKINFLPPKKNVDSENEDGKFPSAPDFKYVGVIHGSGREKKRTVLHPEPKKKQKKVVVRQSSPLPVNYHHNPYTKLTRPYALQFPYVGYNPHTLRPPGFNYYYVYEQPQATSAAYVGDGTLPLSSPTVLSIPVQASYSWVPKTTATAPATTSTISTTTTTTTTATTRRPTVSSLPKLRESHPHGYVFPKTYGLSLSGPEDPKSPLNRIPDVITGDRRPEEEAHKNDEEQREEYSYYESAENEIESRPERDNEQEEEEVGFGPAYREPSQPPTTAAAAAEQIFKVGETRLKTKPVYDDFGYWIPSKNPWTLHKRQYQQQQQHRGYREGEDELTDFYDKVDRDKIEYIIYNRHK